MANRYLDMALKETPKVAKPTNRYLSKALEEPEDVNPNLDTSNLEKAWSGTPVKPDRMDVSNFALEEDNLMSKSELYDPIDNNPKYKALREWEADPSNTPVARVPFTKQVPEEVLKLRTEREQERQDTFQNMGEKKTILGMDVGLRTQKKLTLNPDFKGDVTEEPVNIEQEYLVPGPHDHLLPRMAYQVLENLAGIPDLITGNISQEGPFSKALPDTVPDSGTEQVFTDMTSLIVGPGVATKGAKALGVGAKALVGSEVAASLLTKFRPGDVQYVKDAYEAAIKRGASIAQANAKAVAATKFVTMGVGLGLTEAAVSGENADGLSSMTGIPEAIQETFGLDKSRAKDIALVLDTPVINGSIKTFAMAGRALKEKLLVPVFGGVRNSKIAGGVAGDFLNKSGFGPSEYSVGFNFMNWLDPNLANTKSPSIFKFRVQALADTISRNSEKELMLSGASATLQRDTATSLIPAAQEYFNIAYAPLKEQMGDEAFKVWVDKQSSDLANRLYEQRTAMAMDPRSASKFAESSKTLSELMDMGARNQAKGSDSVAHAQAQAGDYMAGLQKDDLTIVDNKRREVGESLLNSEQKVFETDLNLQTAKADLDKAVTDNPEIKSLLERADNDILGSDKALREEISKKVPQKIYDAWKTLKTESDDAYRALGNTGAKGDSMSILQILEKGDPEKKNSFIKSIRTDIAKDDSFKNIYNNIRKKVSDEIGDYFRKGEKPPAWLNDLNRNIKYGQLEYLEKKGDLVTVDLAKRAKEKYLNLQTGAYDEKSLESLFKTEGKERLQKEPQAVGLGNPLGQGVTNWNTKAVETVTAGLDKKTSDEFVGALKRLGKAGGKPVDKELSAYYANKSLKSIYETMTNGTPSVEKLRGALSSGLIENIERFNPKLAQKYRSLALDLETKANVVKEAQSAKQMASNEAKETKISADAIKMQLDDLDKELKESVFSQFLTNGKPLGQSGTAQRMKTIFTSENSVTQLNDLLKKAEDLGPDGDVIREALKSSYTDFLKERIFSDKPLGIAGYNQRGLPVSAMKADEKEVLKAFKEGSKDMENLRSLFADEPEVIEELRKIGEEAVNSTKTIGASKEQVLGSVPISEDPTKAVGSMIAITFGTLNPTAVTLRRVTTPWTARSLDELKRFRYDVLAGLMVDPTIVKKYADIISNKAMSDSQKKEAIQKAASLVIKGTRGEDVNSGNVKVKVPKGVK